MMKSVFNRRVFLAGSSGLAAGAAAASLLGQTASAGEAKSALCLACRDAVLKHTGEKDCWAALKAIGADGTEASLRDDLSLPGLFHPERRYSVATDAEVETLRADLKATGKRITAFCMYNRFEERPDMEVELGTKIARVAQAMGVPAVRIDVVPRKMSAEEFLDLSARTLKRLLEATQSTGVAFAIENHGRTTNDPQFLGPLFDRVGSPRLGLTLDTGNFYWFGHPLSKVYELYERFAARVHHTHCKSIRFPESEREHQRPIGWEYGKYNCPVDEGDIDFRRVVKILRGAGYANDLCIEDESLGKFPVERRREVLAREIRHLKECRDA